MTFNRSEVSVTKITNSTPLFHVTLTHYPSGVTVSKDNCRSHIKDVEPLYEELEKKVEEYIKERPERNLRGPIKISLDCLHSVPYPAPEGFISMSDGHKVIHRGGHWYLLND